MQETEFSRLPKLPLIFFLDFHDIFAESGTSKAVRHFLPRFKEYKHVCFEAPWDLNSSSFQSVSQRPGYMELVQLLRDMQSEHQICFHPIDEERFLIDIKHIFLPHREEEMVNKIIKVVTSVPYDEGIIVFCGLTHYKAMIRLKTIFPNRSFISFLVVQDSKLLSLPHVELIDDSGNAGFDVLSKQLLIRTLELSPASPRGVRYIDDNFTFYGLKISPGNEQLIYEQIAGVLLSFYYESLKNEIQIYLKKYPSDKQEVLSILDTKQYDKLLRMACNCGRTELINILLDYQPLLNFDPNIHNSNGLSAKNFALKFLSTKTNLTDKEVGVWSRFFLAVGEKPQHILGKFLQHESTPVVTPSSTPGFYF